MLSCVQRELYILHVFITRNSSVSVRKEEHSISDGMALDWRPKVCCNVARLSLPGGFNVFGHFFINFKTDYYQL